MSPSSSRFSSPSPSSLARPSADGVLGAADRAWLEERLAAYVPHQRWFRSKTRAIASVRLGPTASLPAADAEVLLAVARVAFAEGPAEDYALFLTSVEGDAGDRLAREHPEAVVGAVAAGEHGGGRWVVDALVERPALRALILLLAGADAVSGDGCTISLRRWGPALTGTAEPRPVAAEQSNTSVVFGDAILKMMRRLDDGRSPELELGEFLTRAGYDHTPPLRASIELSRGPGEPCTLGTVHTFVPNEGDAWRHALALVARSWARPEPPEDGGNGDDGEAAAGAIARDESVAFVRALAARVAQMHAALASETDDPRFSPEPLLRDERESLGRAVLASLARAWELLDGRPERLSAEARELAARLRSREEGYRRCVSRFVEHAEGAWKTRVHGDLHLGQVIVSAGDFVLVDFEGEPGRTLAERKAKRSPLVDVAGMLRSLHYASVAAWRAAPPSVPAARPRAEAWLRDAHREFVRSYFDAAAVRSALPRDAQALSALLHFHLLEKCVYELHYEMNSRPDWITIPLFGLEPILEPNHVP